LLSRGLSGRVQVPVDLCLLTFCHARSTVLCRRLPVTGRVFACMLRVLTIPSAGSSVISCVCACCGIGIEQVDEVALAHGRLRPCCLQVDESLFQPRKRRLRRFAARVLGSRRLGAESSGSHHFKRRMVTQSLCALTFFRRVTRISGPVRLGCFRLPCLRHGVAQRCRVAPVEVMG
jgi:hypothetical protein